METHGEPPPHDADGELHGVGRASRRVEAILAAAEHAADELRLDAERRSTERIAEAQRAADNWVSAAEHEARELLDGAQRQSAEIREATSAETARMLAEAQARAEALLEGARTEAAETQQIAEVFAAQTRQAAEDDARQQLADARDAAAEVLAEGTQLGENLHALSGSLYANAERLLADVAAAHRAFVATLDRAGVAVPPLANGSRRSEPVASAVGGSGSGGVDFGDVPEFIPGRPLGG